MKIEFKSWDWKKQGEMDLSLEVFEAPFHEESVAQMIRWQRAKARSGNHETKTRSDVSGTTRKPWGQKEAGRSRQGSLKGPHFRGGGVVFGPHKRDHSFKLNKRLKKIAAVSTLSSKLKDGLIDVVKDYAWPFEKTKQFVEWKAQREYKSILFVTGDELETTTIHKVISNVPYVNILPARGFNVYDCIKHRNLIMDVNAVEQVTKRFSCFEEYENEEEFSEISNNLDNEKELGGSK